MAKWETAKWTITLRPIMKTRLVLFEKFTSIAMLTNELTNRHDGLQYLLAEVTKVNENKLIKVNEKRTQTIESS